MINTRGLLVFCLSLAAAPLAAQTDSANVARTRLLRQLQPGATLRLFVRSQPSIGVLERVSADTIYLEQRGFRIGDVDRIQLRQRATRRGVKLGAIIGGVGGTVFGALVGYLAYGLCDTGDCPDSPAGPVVVGTLGGAVSGTLAGALLGGVVGAALPRWVDINDEHARLSNPPPRRLGVVSLAPVVARAHNGGGTGLGTRASLMFQTRHFSLGPEAAWQSLGTTERPVLVPCSLLQGCTDTIPLKESVWQLGGTARLGAGADRRVEPYATAGTGLQVWRRGSMYGSTGLLGYSLGAGVQFRNEARRNGLFAEARWQSNVSRPVSPGLDFGYYTMAVGGALAW